MTNNIFLVLVDSQLIWAKITTAMSSTHYYRLMTGILLLIFKNYDV